jgi:uncharacterized protein YndB with AHSA1/START domain
MAMNKPSGEGTVSAPTYHEGPVYVGSDMRMHERYYTYRTGSRLVSGWTASVVITIDRPVKVVWPYIKDWNPWMNSYGYYWSGVIGDLEGKSFYITIKMPNGDAPEYPYRYDVLRVIPEHLIAVAQPIPEDGGNGGVSPGFHVITLDERDGKTIVTFTMEHALGTQEMTEDQAVATWREGPYQQMWRDSFVPTLKKLIYEGK